MKRLLQTIVKILLIFIFFYVLFSFVENILNIEVEPYMIYSIFIIVAASLGWTAKKGK